MRIPNLNQLKAFEAAGRHENFNLAATELFVTQGAVAQHVRALEADLGKQLFERLPRGLRLTPQGRAYHASVSQALGMIKEATTRLVAPSNRVTISVPPSFAARWLVPNIGLFSEENPDIELQIIAEERVVDLSIEDATMAVRQGPPPNDWAVSQSLLVHQDLRAVCAPSFHTHSSQFSSARDFRRERLCQDGHYYWDKLFKLENITPDHRITYFNQTLLAMDAAIAGLGIALVPRLYLERSFESGTLRELWKAPDIGNAAFYVVWPTHVKSGPILAVRDWLLAKTADPNVNLP